MMIGPLDAAVILAYAVVLVGIGVASVGGQRSAETFYLGGRMLRAFRVFGSTFSTFFGTGLVFTFAALGYRFGGGAFLLPFAAVVGILLLAWAAPHLKAESDRLEAITLPALLADRWRPRTQLVAALVTAVLFTGTLAVNLLVVGDVVGAFVDVRPAVTIGVAAALVVGYTVVGGFQAVVWTDIVQLVLILLGVVVVLPVVVVGTVTDPITASLPAGHLDPRTLPVPVLVAYLLIGLFAFFGSQDLFQRIFAARSPSAARRGVLAFTVPLLVVGMVAVGLGVVARGVVPAVGPDRALLALVRRVSPVGVSGLMLVGLLALANSDADSQLLTVASTVTDDFFPAVGVDPDRPVRIDRVVVVGIGSGATAIALAMPGVTALFGALGSWFAILGFVVLASLYWERTTDLAAFSGLLVGFLAPPVFVLATGNFQAATVVGLVPAALVVVGASFLDGSGVWFHRGQRRYRRWRRHRDNH